METIEEYIEGFACRYELVALPSRLWSIHDMEEHTYTWGLTMDEVRRYMARLGVDMKEVPIVNEWFKEEG